MRKISDARSSYLDINAMADDLRVTRSLRRPGSTIPPWSGSHNIDHDMFACWGTGGTVVGAASAKALPTNCPPAKRRTRKTFRCLMELESPLQRRFGSIASKSGDLTHGP